MSSTLSSLTVYALHPLRCNNKCKNSTIYEISFLRQEQAAGRERQVLAYIGAKRIQTLLLCNTLYCPARNLTGPYPEIFQPVPDRSSRMDQPIRFRDRIHWPYPKTAVPYRTSESPPSCSGETWQPNSLLRCNRLTCPQGKNLYSALGAVRQQLQGHPLLPAAQTEYLRPGTVPGRLLPPCNL